MSTVTGIRVISAFALFLLTLLAGGLPPLFFTLYRRRKRNNVLSITKHDGNKKPKLFNYHNIMQILMFFGGGILLATCFCHLIPEVRENLDHYFEHQKSLTFRSLHNHNHPHHHDHDHEDGEVTKPPTVPLSLTSSIVKHNANDSINNLNMKNSSTSSTSSVNPLTSSSSNINLTREEDHHHGHSHGDHDHDDQPATSSTPHRHHRSGHQEHLDHGHVADKEEGDHDHDHHLHNQKHSSDTPRTAALHGHPDHVDDEGDFDPAASSPHSHDGHSHGTPSGQKQDEHSHNHGLPYVELCVCGGFFVIYLLEELVHTFIGHHHESHENAESDEGQGPRRPSESASIDSRSLEEDVETASSSSGSECSPPTNFKNNGGPTMPLSVTSSVDDLTPTVLANLNQANNGHHSPGNLSENKRMAFTNFAIDLKNEGNLIMSHPSVVSSPLTPETPESIASSTHAMIFATRSTATLVPGEYQGLSIPDKGGYSNHKTFHSNPASVRFIQGLVIIIAFSAHSIFDGVAIGLQEESTRIWTMFFAICSHKLVVALAVGMELFEKTGSIVMTASLMAIFSSMSPIGIFIVILTESKISDNDSPLIILLSAVATGTILYIVFFEILQRNKGHSNNKSPPPQSFGLILYISMIFGFSCMLYMTLYVVH